MVLVQTYLVYQFKSISIPGRHSTLLLLRMARRQSLEGQYEHVVMKEVLLQVTRGSIIIIVTFYYVLMYQVEICQGTVVHNILRIIGGYKINPKRIGGGFSVVEGLASSQSKQREWGELVPHYPTLDVLI